MTVCISSRPARAADNVAAVVQNHSLRVHAMQTARDRAAVIQPAYPVHDVNPVTVRGDNPAVVVKPGNGQRPHRRLRRRCTRVILNQTAAVIGQLADGNIFVVQAIIAAPYRAAVGHIGRSGSGSAARQGNTGPVAAANKRPDVIDQVANKIHPDAIRAARNATGGACRNPVGQGVKRRIDGSVTDAKATDAPARCCADVAGVGQGVACAAYVNCSSVGTGGGDVAAVGNTIVVPCLNGSNGRGRDRDGAGAVDGQCLIIAKCADCGSGGGDISTAWRNLRLDHSAKKRRGQQQGRCPQWR